MIDRSAERGDLALDELRMIRRHLTGCASCREYEWSMRQAAEALSVLALNPPLLPDAPSLWQELELRIAQQGPASLFAVDESPKARRTAWRRVGSAVRAWMTSNSDERFQGAWLRDELRETIATAVASVSFGTRFRMGLIAASGVGAMLTALWIAIPAMQQRELAARDVIASNRSVPAELVGPPTAVMILAPDHDGLAAQEEASTVGQLTQAELPAKVVDSPAPAAEPTPVAKIASPPIRFNYDLEHGTPMPPDSRDPKPVY